MSLTLKILVFTGLLVIALVGITLGLTTFQANTLARVSIENGLNETKGVWETFQADRFNKLRLGLQVLGNDSTFKALVTKVLTEEGSDPATLYDTLKERQTDVQADFFVATDPGGVVIARSDRPAGQGEDLSSDPLVAKPLDDGEGSATVWKQGNKLFHAVSTLMQTGPEVVGVLIAGYAIDETLALDIEKLTHSKVAFLTRGAGAPVEVAVSSLGPREAALRAALTRPELVTPSGTPFELDLDGDRYIGVQVPLQTASGELVGSALALRSLAEEMASFTRFRNSLILTSLGVMLIGLIVAYAAASRITGPVRRLVSLVDKARDGSYAGAVTVATKDEIGTLARTFNALLADLREKEQMIGFLREGLTLMKKGGAPAGKEEPGGVTASLEALDSGSSGITTSILLDRGQVFADRYEIRETLGKGGMGIVYRALDRKLDEDVALKLLRPDVIKDDPKLLERFKQEIKLARRITHRNVLRTHDFGEAGGVPFISMEYLEGVTLKDLVRSKGALPLGVGLGVAKQMCQGLEAAHAGGVVHRDIKPQNMLIVPETGDLKIMDFGIANEVKGTEAGLTSTGMVMGTPDYMPPEQAQGEAADFRSDIYSLGVVFFEIFTGELPFKGSSVMTIVLGHISQAPPAPRSINARVRGEMESVILKCLEKDPAKRYQKVGEIVDDLDIVSAFSGAA